MGKVLAANAGATQQAMCNIFGEIPKCNYFKTSLVITIFWLEERVKMYFK